MKPRKPCLVLSGVLQNETQTTLLVTSQNVHHHFLFHQFQVFKKIKTWTFPSTSPKWQKQLNCLSFFVFRASPCSCSKEPKNDSKKVVHFVAEKTTQIEQFQGVKPRCGHKSMFHFGSSCHVKVALLSRFTCLFWVSFLLHPRQSPMGRRGQAIEVPQGWFNVGPRPPSVRWPQAQSSRQSAKVVRDAPIATPVKVFCRSPSFSAEFRWRFSSQEWSSSHSRGDNGACTSSCNAVGVRHATTG